MLVVPSIAISIYSKVRRFQLEGQVVVCDDFNARCGGLKDLGEDRDVGISGRVSVDIVNEQGNVYRVQDCFVNKRNDFTCISSRGCSVTDYCLVPAEELDSITNFVVKTMSQCKAVLCRNEEGYCLPDHSVLLWDLVVGSYVCDSLQDTSKGSDRRSTRYVVPEEYMTNDADFIQSIMGDIKAVGR